MATTAAAITGIDAYSYLVKDLLFAKITPCFENRKQAIAVAKRAQECSSEPDRLEGQRER